MEGEVKNPWWLFLAGGGKYTFVCVDVVMFILLAFIVLGLATLGYRVLHTMGEKITHLNPSRGFSAEISGSFIVMFASVLGMCETEMFSLFNYLQECQSVLPIPSWALLAVVV